MKNYKLPLIAVTKTHALGVISFILITLLVSFSSLYAQPGSLNQGINEVEMGFIPVVQDEKPSYNDEELKLKIKMIDQSAASPEEKERLKQEFLASIQITDEQKDDFKPIADFTFQPKYFSVTILEQWKSVVLKKNPSAMKNIIIVNEAYAVDYNNYYDRAVEQDLIKLIAENPVGQDLALKYIIPNLNIMKESKPDLNSNEMVNMLQLYFAQQPGLFYLLPLNLSRLIKNKNRIMEIYNTKR